MARTVVMPPESTVTMPMHSQIMRVLLRQRSEHWEIRGPTATSPSIYFNCRRWSGQGLLHNYHFGPQIVPDFAP